MWQQSVQLKLQVHTSRVCLFGRLWLAEHALEGGGGGSICKAASACLQRDLRSAHNVASVSAAQAASAEANQEGLQQLQVPVVTDHM